MKNKNNSKPASSSTGPERTDSHSMKIVHKKIGPTDSFTADFEAAKRHLRALDNRPDAKFTFQTFLDGEGDESRRRAVTRVLHGTFEQHKHELARLNRCGAGIYVTVNETDGKGRTKENIVSIRSVFADQDGGPLPPLPLEPTLVIESKRGQHLYWRVGPEMTAEEFRSAQKGIAHRLGTDPSVCDPPRVMRLAGFYHMKDPANPFFVTVKSASDHRYTKDEIFAAFPPKPAPTQLNSQLKPEETSKGPLDAFASWAESLPTEQGQANPLRGRNCTLLLLIREGLGCRVSEPELQRISHNYCRRAGLDTTIASKMLQRQVQEHAKSPFVSYYIKPKKKCSAAEAMELFLIESELLDESHLKLRYYKDDFYRYLGDRYARVPRTELRAEAMAFLQSHTSSGMVATLGFANNVVGNLEGKTLVPETIPLSSFLSDIIRSETRLVPMENGILDVDQYMAANGSPLLPHTPDFFSTCCLPYAYDPKARCPTWQKFLNEALPDLEIQTFLQEWFGYNLVFDTSHHLFVMLIGQGANGKTVVCGVLRSLLGKENVSSVGLEQFDPKRTFPLAAMSGKLANIVEEIGETEKTAEGVLKDFVSGGTMTIEKKHKDPFETSATARLTFATNVMPRFTDRSSGLWRRIMPVPFLNQVLDPAKQDKRLVQSKFWEESGELPGVLNWALQGLARLYKVGSFTAPKACLELRNEYRKEANLAATFLELNCVATTGGRLAVNRLYDCYVNWMTNQRATPLGGPQFTREVKKLFPKARQSENAKRQSDGSRSREWEGLGFIDGIPADCEYGDIL